MKAGDRVRVITPAGSKYYRRALRISRSGQIERRLGAIIVPIGDLKVLK